MTEHTVVIAGGGPTGLMLAGELALAGVDVANGKFAFRHVAVDYRVGPQKYRAVFRSSLRLCAPITTPVDSCVGPPI